LLVTPSIDVPADVRRASAIALPALLALSLTSWQAHAAEPTNSALPAWAPPPKPNVVEDRFRVEVTLLGAGFDTQVRVDPSLTQPGTVINAEDDLGLDSSQLLPMAEITLLPGDHHLIRLSGLSSRRSANTILDETIVFDQEVYLPGERVDSTLNLTMLGLTYGNRFLLKRRGELTASFGIQVVEVEANAVVRNRVVREAESTVAPLPLIGLEGRYDFTQRWSAEARVQYVSGQYEDIDGTVLDARAAVTWRMNPYVVFGLGYRSFSVEVDSRDPDEPGFVDMSIDGPQLFMRASL
jgi:hypothetical protein